MAADKWEIYEDNTKQWRWRLTASNGNIVGASTQGYTEKKHCQENAEHYGMNGKFNTAGKWEIYQDNAKKWRWRHTADNGNIIGASSESYNARGDCEENAKRHGWKQA